MRYVSESGFLLTCTRGGRWQFQKYAYRKMYFTCSRLELPGSSTLNTDCHIKWCYQQVTPENRRINEAKYIHGQTEAKGTQFNFCCCL